MHDFYGKPCRAGVAGQFGMNRRLSANQEHTHAIMTSRLDRAFNFRFGSAVRTHRIQGYGAWHDRPAGGLAGLLDLDHFAAFVVAAFGADTMRQLALVTVRTLGE